MFTLPCDAADRFSEAFQNPEAQSAVAETAPLNNTDCPVSEQLPEIEKLPTLATVI